MGQDNAVHFTCWHLSKEMKIFVQPLLRDFVILPSKPSLCKSFLKLLNLSEDRYQGNACEVRALSIRWHCDFCGAGGRRLRAQGRGSSAAGAAYLHCNWKRIYLFSTCSVLKVQFALSTHSAVILSDGFLCHESKLIPPCLKQHTASTLQAIRITMKIIGY